MAIKRGNALSVPLVVSVNMSKLAWPFPAIHIKITSLIVFILYPSTDACMESKLKYLGKPPDYPQAENLACPIGDLRRNHIGGGDFVI